MLLGMNTPGGQWNIVLDVGPDPQQRGGGAQFWILGPSPLFGTAEARDLKFKFWVHVGGGDPNENYAKVGHGGSGSRLKLQSWNFVCL